jgi:hypothetical protein
MKANMNQELRKKTIFVDFNLLLKQLSLDEESRNNQLF